MFQIKKEDCNKQANGEEYNNEKEQWRQDTLDILLIIPLASQLFSMLIRQECNISKEITVLLADLFIVCFSYSYFIKNVFNDLTEEEKNKYKEARNKRFVKLAGIAYFFIHVIFMSLEKSILGWCVFGLLALMEIFIIKREYQIAKTITFREKGMNEDETKCGKE